MKVLVTYTSGKTRVFLVPGSMRVIDFMKLAEPLGGKIRRVEFP